MIDSKHVFGLGNEKEVVVERGGPPPPSQKRDVDICVCVPMGWYCREGELCEANDREEEEKEREREVDFRDQLQE